MGTLISLFSFTFSYSYAMTHFDMGLGLATGGSALAIWGTGIWAMIIGAVLLSLTGGALQFIISMYSRNMREAQLYLGQMGMVILPFIFILMQRLPMLQPCLPGYSSYHCQCFCSYI